jgi:hypothetical protein
MLGKRLDQMRGLQSERGRGGGYEGLPLMCWRIVGMLCVVVARYAERNETPAPFGLALDFR